MLSGVDVVGSWRTRQRGRKLTVAVTTFRPLTKSEQAGSGEEARRLAVARGLAPDAVDLAVG